jgi:hypothetical protein
MPLTIEERKLVVGWIKEYPAGVPSDSWRSDMPDPGDWDEDEHDYIDELRIAELLNDQGQRPIVLAAG